MRTARCIILLLCLCALALRAGGTHVHVALDHEDVHAEDGQNHVHLTTPDLHQELHPEHDVQEIDDAVTDRQQHIEVSLDGQALSKKPSLDLGLEELLFAAVLILLLLAPRKLILSPILLITPPWQRLLHLRPPLRGPPLHA